MGHDVFICHAVENKQIAESIVEYLETNNISCWIAPRNVLPGSDWAGSIVNAIENAKVMILIFSRYSNDSKHVLREVEKADGKMIPVIPFRIEDILPTKSFEYFLRTQQWLDAFSPPLESHFPFLAENVKRLLEEAAVKPQEQAEQPVLMTKQEIAPPVQAISRGPAVTQKMPKSKVWLILSGAVLLLIFASVYLWVPLGGYKPPKKKLEVATQTPIAPVPDKLTIPPSPDKEKPEVATQTPVGRWPWTSQRLISKTDLQSFSPRDLDLMRNEIFARHGWVFKRPDLQDYFEQQPWYRPKGDLYNQEQANRRAEAELTFLERQNTETIKSRENELKR